MNNQNNNQDNNFNPMQNNQQNVNPMQNNHQNVNPMQNNQHNVNPMQNNQHNVNPMQNNQHNVNPMQNNVYQNNPNYRNKPLLEQTGFIVFMIFMFWPLGLILMWIKSNWKMVTKIVISSIYGFAALVMLIAIIITPPVQYYEYTATSELLVTQNSMSVIIPETPAIPASPAVYETVVGSTTRLGYGTYYVGTHIAAGTYTIIPVSGYDYVEIGYSFNVVMGFNMFDPTAANARNNIVLKEGAEIKVMDVELDFKAPDSQVLVKDATDEIPAQPAKTVVEAVVINGDKITCTVDLKVTDCGKLTNYSSLVENMPAKVTRVESISFESSNVNPDVTDFENKFVCSVDSKQVDCNSLFTYDLLIEDLKFPEDNRIKIDK